MADPTSTPSIINDGNWGALSLMDFDYDFPFSDVGDNVTWQADATFMMDRQIYRPRASMSLFNFPMGNAYLTKLGKTQSVGNGILRFTDQYSVVPQNRTEYGSFTYTMQFYETAIASSVDPSKYFYDVTYDLEEQTFTIPAQFRYEYFLNAAPTPLLRSRAFLLFGKLYIIGGSPVINGTNIVGEDSNVKIWAGRIFERRTVYVSTNPSLIG